MGTQKQHLQPELVYEIDGNNIIQRIDGPWDEFAQSNAQYPAELEECLKDQVLGRPVFEFITGQRIRLFFLSVLNATRLLNRTRRVQYRCDSELEKRFMEMVMEPLEGQAMRLSHVLVRTELLKRPFLFTSQVSPGHRPVPRCSVCNRVEISEAWVEPDDEVVRGMPRPCPVTHTLCPICEDGVLPG